MKTIAAVAVMLVLGPSNAFAASAADIQGKWGIGAGVFGGGGEVSFIRGKSERSAWLFDVSLTHRYDASETEVTPPSPVPPSMRRTFAIAFGPGLRRFTRAGEEFTPYCDLRLRGTYARTSQSFNVGDIRTDTGVRGEFAIGLEYFTRWHFSVAAHSGLAQVDWVHSTNRQTTPAVEAKTTGNSVISTIRLAPVLFVRGYW